MNAPARWWVAGSDGRTWGPFDAATIHGYLREGRVTPADRVCAEGASVWVQLTTVEELAPPLGSPAGMPPPPPPPAHRASFGLGGIPAGGDAPFDLAEVRPEDTIDLAPIVTVLLSIVTFGIWAWVVLYQTGMRYRRLAGIQRSNFEGLFWTSVALSVCSPLFWPLGIAGLIVSVLVVRDVIDLRDQAMHRVAQREPVPVFTVFKTREWHMGMFVAGVLLWWIAVGFVLLIVQCVQFCNERNRVAATIRARLQSAGRHPA